MGAAGMTLTGKIAIVTGASSGIGAAIARKLAEQGAWVSILYRRNSAGAEALVRSITNNGGVASSIACDVADPSDVAATVTTVVHEFGRIDILVNNAGIIEPGLLGAIDPASFERQFSVNALSVLLVMQACLPHFPASGGRIINISSSLALAPLESTVIYSASKAAVHAMTQGFARELGKRQITVNAIAPGATATEMTAGIDPTIKNRISAATPLGRWARPEDIAGTAVFLASDAAQFITGRVIIVDGGLI